MPFSCVFGALYLKFKDYFHYKYAKGFGPILAMWATQRWDKSATIELQIMREAYDKRD